MDHKIFVSNYERPYFYTRPILPPPPPPAIVSHHSHAFNLNDKVSPNVLLIIIILAVIFFMSGLLHLLVRYLMRPINRDPDDEFDDVSVLQGQLQQLFHLHDSGVDQSFIDRLPVFSYKSIIGVKDPFDCAVCLCEFEGEDKLRLLPKCSHAFHMDCIDTWLLSHSTCPLCRGSLLCDVTQTTCFSPIVLVLESGSGEISREGVNNDQPNGPSIEQVNSHLSNVEFEFDKGEVVKEDEDKEKVVTIKLGKFKSVGGGGGGGGEGSGGKQAIDGRRCFSMGCFEYVMNESSSLQVPISTHVKKQASKKSTLPITSSHRVAMSECGGDSRRDFKGIDVFGGGGGGAIGKSKKESFSVSKSWFRGQKDKATSTATATIGPSKIGSFSFRFPVHRNESKANRRANSELSIGRWKDDQEVQVCQWLDSFSPEASKTPSFARTLLWLMGRQQIKAGHSSTSTNV